MQTNPIAFFGVIGIACVFMFMTTAGTNLVVNWSVLPKTFAKIYCQNNSLKQTIICQTCQTVKFVTCDWNDHVSDMKFAFDI